MKICKYKGVTQGCRHEKSMPVAKKSQALKEQLTKRSSVSSLRLKSPHAFIKIWGVYSSGRRAVLLVCVGEEQSASGWNIH